MLSTATSDRGVNTPSTVYINTTRNSSMMAMHSRIVTFPSTNENRRSWLKSAIRLYNRRQAINGNANRTTTTIRFWLGTIRGRSLTVVDHRMQSMMYIARNRMIPAKVSVFPPEWSEVSDEYWFIPPMIERTNAMRAGI